MSTVRRSGIWTPVARICFQRESLFVTRAQAWLSMVMNALAPGVSMA